MQIHSLSAFASRHQTGAVGLIIGSELCNAVLGLLLGSALLADQPGWSLSVLLAGLVLVRALFCRYRAIRLLDLESQERFWFQKNSFAFLFLINFLAYVVAGGISGRAIMHPEPAVSVTSESYHSSSTSSEKDSVGQITPKQILLPHFESKTEDEPPTNTKGGYVLLFLVSIPLFILSSRLACSLACSNQGFLAVFVMLLGLGIFAGGFYFLGRALTRNMKLYREMTRAERKREGRRYLRTLLATIAGLTVFGLLLSVFSR